MVAATRTLVAVPLLLLLQLCLAIGTTGAVNHSLSHLPFSWDTIPRYSFCSNSSAAYASEGYGGIGLFNNESLHYIAKQDIMLYGTAEHRPAGGPSSQYKRVLEYLSRYGTR